MPSGEKTEQYWKRVKGAGAKQLISKDKLKFVEDVGEVEKKFTQFKQKKDTKEQSKKVTESLKKAETSLTRAGGFDAKQFELKLQHVQRRLDEQLERSKHNRELIEKVKANLDKDAVPIPKRARYLKIK